MEQIDKGAQEINDSQEASYTYKTHKGHVN